MIEPREPGPTGSSRGVRVTRSWESDRLVLVLQGDLDMDTLAAAQDEVTAAQGEEPPVLVLDLSRLGFVDSCGVRLVLLAQHLADDAHRRLAVRLGHGTTRRLFDRLGITEQLEVLDHGEAS